MRKTRGLLRLAGLLAGVGVVLGAGVSAMAQTTDDDFSTGVAAASWQAWQAAMQAILDRKPEQVETRFAELLEHQPSPLRLALLAHRTVWRTGLGGAVLLFELDRESRALGPNGQKVADLLAGGQEQMNQADDGWYFCSIGRFDVADANFRALLAADPDPVALVEFTDAVKKRREILVQLATNAVVGESIRGVLRMLDRGEELIKADPLRILANIERLGGPPRAYENAEAWLRQSGEYAVPFLVQALRDRGRQHLTLPIRRCLPRISRPALNPLVMALRVEEPAVRGYLIEALGQIGYPQAAAYLLQLREKSAGDAATVAAVDAALAMIRQRDASLPQDLTAAEAFYRLAEAYYRGDGSLAADARLETANVWYWRDDLVQNVPVPTAIFDEVMCLRCAEEALRLDPGLKKAQALWLAANFRRVAQLPEGEIDRTRPENYPPPGYFAQSAGAGVCLMALTRAVDDRDPAVALGLIHALRSTGGPASVVADVDGRLPLAEALSFPDRMVRVRAALTLGHARPTRPFLGHQNLMPALCEALLLFGGARTALVVEPDTENGNRLAGVLRADGYEVVSDVEFLRGLNKVRAHFPALDVILLASDLQDVPLPAALAQLRGEFRFAATPVVIVARPGQRELVRDLVRGDHRLGQITPEEAAEPLLGTVAEVSRRVGVSPITPELGAELALEAAQTLRMLAVTNNPLVAIQDAQAALISAMGTSDPHLRLAVAQSLGHVPTTAAQEAIAKNALDESVPEEMRINMFAALAEAARNCGNQLGPETIARVVKIAESEPDLLIRTAASQALGALNLPTDKGSEIIRNQYGG